MTERNRASATVEECICNTYRFNEIAENFSSIDGNKLLAQSKVVLEEAQELFTAIKKVEGPEQVLKECVDVLVTITGMVGMLETLGYDVWGAWNEVNKNNLTKFPASIIDALDTLDSLKAQGVTELSSQYNEDEGVFIIKDGNGKIRKPLSYEKCSVKSFLPQ